MAGGWGGWASLVVSTPPSSHWCDAKVNSRTQATTPQVPFYLQRVVRTPEVAVCLLRCQSCLPRGGDALATILTRPSLPAVPAVPASPAHPPGTNSLYHITASCSSLLSASFCTLVFPNTTPPWRNTSLFAVPSAAQMATLPFRRSPPSTADTKKSSKHPRPFLFNRCAVAGWQ